MRFNGTFLPQKIDEVGKHMDLGNGNFQRVRWGSLKPRSKVKKMVIFPRIGALDE